MDDIEEEEKNEEKEESPQAREQGRVSAFLEATGLFFLELIKIAVLAGITIGLVRYFLFKPFYVKGQSMESAYFETEYLIIDELTYRFREPTRGEVVVFRSPTQPNDFYLKRVIGLPRERVKIQDQKVIVYNEEHPQGVVLPEEYLDPGTITDGSQVVTLAEDEYYVLGDNRDASFDSRRFGPIHTSAIVGRTWLRGYPFTRVGLLKKPDYNL